MELYSGITKNFKGDFVICADNLIRIEKVMLESIMDESIKANVFFTMHFEDNSYCECTTAEEILTEQNLPGKRITGIDIELYQTMLHEDVETKSFLIAELSFSIDSEHMNMAQKSSSIHLSIRNMNRKFTSNLSDRLSDEVTRTLHATYTPRWLLLILLLPLSYLGYRLMISLVPGFSIGLFLISAVVLGALILQFFFTVIDSSWFYRLFGPESVFLWGHEEVLYKQRESNRMHIQWTVIVSILITSIISVIIGLSHM